MPRRLLRAPDHDRSRSLGWLAVWWIETFTVRGPGDAQGEPVRYGDEFTGFYVDTYGLSPKGRRLYDSAFFSRPKGCDKSGIGAALCLFEALGPCRFAGWAEGGETYTFLGQTYTYRAGEPMGRPVKAPFVRVMATEEDQTGNVYDTIYYNLTDESAPLSQLKAYGLDAGLTRVMLPYGGEIRPSTSGAASKDGGLETFACFDEALALDTPLPTPTGWTTMGAVQIGDELVGSDGRPVEVVKTTQAMAGRRCWRVQLVDGSSVVASDGHLWETRVSGSAAKPRVRTTGEMVADGRRFAVPRQAALSTPPVDLDIDPYVLGAWLGDGDKGNAFISVADSDRDDLIGQIEARGYTATPSGHGLYVSVPGSHRNRFSPVRGLKVRLRDADLLGHKRIPAEYLRAGTSQRLELLRGLMDTDGSVSPAGHCTFTQTDPGLTGQVLELLRSLGQRPRRIFVPDVRSRCGGYFKVHFTPTGIVPFGLGRKAERVRESLRATRWTAIESITEVDSVPVRCVGVNSADHLFVAGRGWIVTHNTHLYNTGVLKRMYGTVTRNLVKRAKLAEPWCFEPTTMYQPGEKSIAEDTYQLADLIEKGKARRHRLLFDHRWGELELDQLGDEKKLRAAILEAYGDAIEWNEPESVIDKIFDTRTEPEDALRYYLNALSKAVNAWLDPVAWAKCLAETDNELQPRDVITLGFDGSETNDATALVACRVRDRLLVPLIIQEQPDGPEAKDWRVDKVAVDAAVAEAFRTYRVVGFFADPPHWQDEVDKWTREFAGKLRVNASSRHPIAWWTKLDVPMANALERLASAIRGRTVRHSGDRTMTNHFLHARKWKRRGGTVIGKETPASQLKIDAAMAATLAFEAAAQYLVAGKKTTDQQQGYEPRRLR